jgi:Fe-S-cluster containining protein
MNHTSEMKMKLPMMDKGEEKRQSNFFDICRKCKTDYSCCFGTRPPITGERRKIIEEYLKKEKLPIANAFVEEKYAFPKENTQGYCVFHDMRTRKCVIHSIKPETCVSGPITFDINKMTGKIELYMKMDKICPLAGIVYKDKEMLQKHLKSARGEIIHLVDELDSEALKAILKKDEPETFKIE